MVLREYKGTTSNLAFVLCRQDGHHGLFVAVLDETTWCNHCSMWLASAIGLATSPPLGAWITQGQRCARPYLPIARPGTTLAGNDIICMSDRGITPLVDDAKKQGSVISRLHEERKRLAAKESSSWTRTLLHD